MLDCALTASAVGCRRSGQEGSVALWKLVGYPATTHAATGVRQGTKWTTSTEPPSRNLCPASSEANESFKSCAAAFAMLDRLEYKDPSQGVMWGGHAQMGTGTLLG